MKGNQWVDLVRGLVHKPGSLAAVIVPVYRIDMTFHEKIAFEQCLRVLGKHAIFIIAPEDLTFDHLDFPGLVDRVDVERFNRKYFRDTTGYNTLMLSVEFYQRFINYEYVLIYQLDAFVFQDRLLDWCRAGFDYVGAPWMGMNWQYPASIRPYLPIWLRNNVLRRLVGEKDRLVGNGGFSLRNTRKFILVLLLLRSHARAWPVNEDAFWAIIAPSYFPFFRIPTVEQALKFSFELQPRECFERIGRNLPFGCHAWWAYDLEFWRPIFQQHGYEV